MMVGNLCKRGFSCPICSDGISYPEKYILYLLKATSVKFIFQLSKKDFSWCDKYRYDFYLTTLNIIVEVHGSQHYNTPFAYKGSNALICTKTNDNNKMKNALRNGIEKEKYIVTDGRESKKNYILKSILNSGLSNFIDFGDVDWGKIDIQSHGSILKDVCNYYNTYQPISTLEIAEKFSISRDSVVRYLNIGYKYGFCSYDSANSRIEAGKKGNMTTKRLLSKKVDVYKDNTIIKSYNSAKELYRKSTSDFGIQFCYSSICDVCRGITKTHHGYLFKYRKENIND